MKSLLGTPSIGDACQDAVRLFSEAGFESPHVEARALLSGLLKCPTTSLILRSEDILDEDETLLFEKYVQRRLNYEPVAYILGHKNFMGFEMGVDPRVLIPRPETELLVEDVLMEARDSMSENLHILDVGTGSGCIAVSLARLLPKAKIEAVDISPEALELAAKNAERSGVSVHFGQSDIFHDLGPEKQEAFDMILSNPPYIASSDLPGLQPELSYEPRLALDGGVDGLNALRRLISESPFYLKRGGLLALEIGHNQGNLICDLLAQAGFENISVLKDYSGHDRIAKGRKRGSI